MSKPAPSLAPGRFADVSSIAPAGPGRFEAEVHPDWTLGGKPNGGYLLAILGRAAGAAGPHPDVIAASAHYLRSPGPGTVSVEAEVLRAGRGASQVRAQPPRKTPTGLTPGSAAPANAPTPSSKPGASCANSAAAPGRPGNSPRPSTYFRPARPEDEDIR